MSPHDTLFNHPWVQRVFRPTQPTQGDINILVAEKDKAIDAFMNAMQAPSNSPYVYIPPIHPPWPIVFDPPTAKPPSNPNPITDRSADLEVACPERPLVGWRVWAVHLDKKPWRLQSIVKLDTWTPGVRMWGRCKCSESYWISPPAVSPRGTDHFCGVHAHRERSQVKAVEVTAGTVPILGTVWLWGHVVEHKWGWRAEFAYPKAVGGDFSEVAREIARDYRCELL